MSKGIEIADSEEVIEHSIRIGEGTREISAEMVTEDGAQLTQKLFIQALPKPTLIPTLHYTLSSPEHLIFTSDPPCPFSYRLEDSAGIIGDLEGDSDDTGSFTLWFLGKIIP